MRRGFGIQSEPVEHAARPVRRDQVAAQLGVLRARRARFGGEPLRLQARSTSTRRFSASAARAACASSSASPIPNPSALVLSAPGLKLSTLPLKVCAKISGKGGREQPRSSTASPHARGRPTRARRSRQRRTSRSSRRRGRSRRPRARRLLNHTRRGSRRRPPRRRASKRSCRSPLARHALAVQKELPAQTLLGAEQHLGSGTRAQSSGGERVFLSECAVPARSWIHRLARRLVPVLPATRRSARRRAARRRRSAAAAS